DCQPLGDRPQKCDYNTYCCVRTQPPVGQCDNGFDCLGRPELRCRALPISPIFPVIVPPAPCTFVCIPTLPGANGPGGGAGNCVRIGSPLVVDLGGRGIRLTAADDGADFDLYGSGGTERLSWFAEPDMAALLVFDRDGDGAIESGRELFGSS